MTTLGDESLELFDDLSEDAGVALTVTRGTTTTAINAIKGRSFTERFGGEQPYRSNQPSDFIVKVADWMAIVGGEPNTEDFISWADDAGTVRQSQVAVDDRERHFDPVGQFGLLWRIHTVEMAT